MVVEVKCIHCGESAIITKALDMNVFWFNHEACHKGKPSLKIGKNLTDANTDASAAHA